MDFTTFEQFEVFVTENKIKFTTAQKEIINMWRRGYKLITVNQHRVSGGEIYWTKDEGESLDYAGRVYRAAGNIWWSLRKCLNEDNVKLSFGYSSNNNITC